MSDKKITLSLDRTGKAPWFGYQISINLEGEHGYRLMGPKYLGDSEQLRVVTLDERDASEIRQYLDHVDGGDGAAEKRGFDRAVELLSRDREVWRRWAAAAPEGDASSYGTHVAELLAAPAPAVLGNGEQA